MSPLDFDELDDPDFRRQEFLNLFFKESNLYYRGPKFWNF